MSVVEFAERTSSERVKWEAVCRRVVKREEAVPGPMDGARRSVIDVIDGSLIKRAWFGVCGADRKSVV